MAERLVGRHRLTAGLALATLMPLTLAPFLTVFVPGSAVILGAFVVVAYTGHLAVTAWLWSIPDVRGVVRACRTRLVVLLTTLFLLAAIGAVSMPDRLLDYLLLGFFAWQFTHFQRQNMGLVALLASQWGAEPLTAGERRVITTAGVCGTAALLARPALLGLPTVVLPTGISGPTLRLAVAGFVICVAASVAWVSASKRAAPVTGAQVTAVLFVAPVFLFRSAAAAVTGMVVAHGLQYLWVVMWRCRVCRPPDRRERAYQGAGIVFLALGGGVALAALSAAHSATSPLPRLLYGTYLGLVMAHFTIDAVVWHRPGLVAGRPIRTSALLPSPAHGRP